MDPDVFAQRDHPALGLPHGNTARPVSNINTVRTECLYNVGNIGT